MTTGLHEEHDADPTAPAVEFSANKLDVLSGALFFGLAAWL